jgi:hypothetical protein
MCCSLWDATEEHAAEQSTAQAVLAGTLVSSLHRLKDIDNSGKFQFTLPAGGFLVDASGLKMVASLFLEISRSR